MIVDPDKTAAAIAEIAQEEIAERFGKLSKADIKTKTGPNDFVTEADRAAENRLEKALGAVYPGATFIGEESVAANPALLHKLGNEGAFWIVDPLDGTRNFVQGRAEFGTIVALVVNGETRASWIYAIPDDAFAISEKGSGASWRGERLSALTISTGKPLKGYRAIGNMKEPWKQRLTPRLRECFETDPARCSAYAYIHLARGLRDFALYSRIHPWDHAAGVLILNEIGGWAEYLDDRTPYRPYPEAGRPLLVAGSAEVWKSIQRILMGAADA